MMRPPRKLWVRRRTPRARAGGRPRWLVGRASRHRRAIGAIFYGASAREDAALIEARRKSSEPSSVKKARKPAAKKPPRKPASKRARDSDDSSDGEVIHATSAADRAARRKSSNESVRRAAKNNQVPVRELEALVRGRQCSY